MAKLHWGSNAMNLTVAVFARLVWVTILALVMVWILVELAGFASTAIDGNTSKLFNWHIFLAVLGVPVLMTEIVLSKSPPYAGSGSVLVHGALQGCATLCLAGAVTAVLASHLCHVPEIPNLQTAHSWCGVITVCFFGIQFLLGLFLAAFIGISPSIKAKAAEAYGHLKASTYFLGLATATAGIVEKMTFIEEGSKSEPSAVSPILMLPKVVVLLLALLGLSVFYLITYQKPTRASTTVPENEAMLIQPMEASP